MSALDAAAAAVLCRRRGRGDSFKVDGFMVGNFTVSIAREVLGDHEKVAR